MGVGLCQSQVGWKPGQMQVLVMWLHSHAGVRLKGREGGWKMGIDRTGWEMEGANQQLSNVLVECASQHGCVIFVLLYHTIK